VRQFGERQRHSRIPMSMLQKLRLTRPNAIYPTSRSGESDIFVRRMVFLLRWGREKSVVLGERAPHFFLLSRTYRLVQDFVSQSLLYCSSLSKICHLKGKRTGLYAKKALEAQNTVQARLVHHRNAQLETRMRNHFCAPTAKNPYLREG
jgi:hypothetical protein